MWFRNIRLLELTSPITVSAQELEKQLSLMAFQPCAKSLPMSYGWVPPLGETNGALVFSQTRFILLRLRIEEKVLPPAVVREQLADRIKTLEQQFSRKIHKDEKEQLKDEIYQSLLTQAFTKSSYVSGYLDLEKNWLVVDAASSKKLAYFVSLFHKCTEKQAFAPELDSVRQIMTQWLMENNYPDSLCFADAGVLKKLDETSSVARFKNQDLLSKKVQNFLQDGSQAIQLCFEWADQIHFTLKEDFSLSSVRFLEAVKELAQDGLGETAEDRFASDFAIMTETLQAFISELLASFCIKQAEANRI